MSDIKLVGIEYRAIAQSKPRVVKSITLPYEIEVPAGRELHVRIVAKEPRAKKTAKKK